MPLCELSGCRLCGFEGPFVVGQFAGQVLDLVGKPLGRFASFLAADDIVFIPFLEVFQNILLRGDFCGQLCSGSGRLQRLLAHFLQSVDRLLYRCL